MVLLYIFTAALLGFVAGMIITKKRAMRLIEDVEKTFNKNFCGNTDIDNGVRFGASTVKGYVKEFL